MRPSKLQLTWAFPILLVALQGAKPGPRTLAEFPDNCEEGEQASGALSLICMPVEREWNGDLVIYAHGYVAFNEPIEIPDLELPDGTFIILIPFFGIIKNTRSWLSPPRKYPISTTENIPPSWRDLSTRMESLSSRKNLWRI